jgi:capsular polysaccharide biosynthesis protein
VKRVTLVLVCVLVGLAAGGIWTWLQSDRYRADARVLVRPSTSRVVPAVEALAESSLIAQNVAQTLHLSSPPDLSAKRGDGGVLTVSTEAGSRDRARQVDAEAVVILTQKVPQRFPAGRVTTTVLDPAHVAEQTSPTPGRNLLLGGLAGLIVGLALTAALASRRPSPVTGADPGLEGRLKLRVDQVAKRERAMAQRAGQLAAREQDLQRREQEVEDRQAELRAAAEAPEPVPEPEREPEPEPEPEPQPEPEREPEPAPAPTPPPAGGWTLQELETLTRERAQAGASTAQQEEWSTYLFLLREHAGADGSLPQSFDGLVNDVFGPLPQHAG